MSPWLLEPVYWHWLILCAVFLLLEIFTVTFFFLTWATAAAVLAVVTVLYPSLSVALQWLLFAVLSLLAIGFWWQVARYWQRDPNDRAGKLNNRGRALLGRTFVLAKPIAQQYGQLHIDDSLWTIYCDEDLPAGSKVMVTGIDSLTLLVKRVD